MNFFYEIKPDTEVYNKITELLEMKRRWNDKEDIGKKMAELLGFKSNEELDENVACWPHRLMLTNPPEHLKGQFCSNPNRHGYYEAKKKSKINQAWIQFCKENNLTDYDIWEYLNFSVGLFNVRGKKRFQGIEDRYFIESQKEIDVQRFSFLQPMPEHEFLKIRASYLEELEKEKLQQAN